MFESRVHWLVGVFAATLLLAGSGSASAQTEEQSLGWAKRWGATHYPYGTVHELIFRYDRFAASPPLKDADLANLAGLKTSLVKLSLNGPHHITARGFAVLGGYVQLQGLYLVDNTNVGDGELQQIAASLPQLVELGLVGTSISDRGLTHLVGMKNLKRVGLQNVAGITEDGIRQLRQQRPDLGIFR